MKLFSTTLVATIALATSLTSCSTLTDLSSSMAGGGGGGALDIAKNVPAMYVMVLPPAPAVGQAWTMDMSGMETTTAIVAEVDGKFILEQETAMYGEPIVLAFSVDPSVDLSVIPAAGEKMASNVTAAWIGEAGKKPMEHTVMEVMEMPEMTGEAAPAMDVKTGKESLTAAGRSWDTEWSEVSGSKSWSSNGFMIRSDYDGKTVMQLTGWATDAKAQLDWTAGE